MHDSAKSGNFDTYIAVILYPWFLAAISIDAAPAASTSGLASLSELLKNASKIATEWKYDLISIFFLGEYSKFWTNIRFLLIISCLSLGEI